MGNEPPLLVAMPQIATSSAMPASGGSKRPSKPRQSIGSRGVRAARAGARHGGGRRHGLGADRRLRGAAVGIKDGCDHARLLGATVVQAALTRSLKLSAYLAGSLPSQTTPSISLLLRSVSLGTLIFIAPAACLYNSTWLICLATAR